MTVKRSVTLTDMAIRNAEATRDRLMGAALELYAERGYAGTCLDAILQRAMSSKGAFYHHFDSKEDLTARALTVRWEAWMEEIRRLWQRPGTAPEKLDRLLEVLKPHHADTGGCALGMLGFESSNLPAQVRQALADGLQRWKALLCDLLHELGIHDRQSAAELAEQLFVMYQGGVLVQRVNGSHEALARALAAWRQDVLEALGRAAKPR